MLPYREYTKEALLSEKKALDAAYESFKAKGLKLDMSRGKPGADQLDLSLDMLTVMTDRDSCKAGSVDTRNYQLVDGLPEAKALFGELLGVPASQVIAGGNSSLNMMYDAVARAMTFGVAPGMKPWASDEKRKFLCPSPGYDRHFAITELFGFEMIVIGMKDDGPDMAQIASCVEGDPSVKGVWCVPKYSNPTGITYSDEVVKAFAALKPAAPDFRIFWDNAYIVHDLEDEGDRLLNIFEACEAEGKQNFVYEFCSTSKISFPGAGVAAVAMGPDDAAWAKKLLSYQTIGPDKMNQQRHCLYFKNIEGVRKHMKKHAAILKPKFRTVLDTMEKELGGLGVASWHEPRGGYFISLDVLDGTAKETLRLAAEAGVVMTPAGSTYPLMRDPNDRNIRIAPTFPKSDELAVAVALLCVCVKLAAINKLLA